MGVLSAMGARLRAGLAVMAGGQISTGDNPDHWIFRHVGHRTHSSIPVSESLALNLSAVWACVTLMADAIALLPLDVFRKQGDERLPQSGHPVARLFSGAANEDATSGTIVSTATMHALLWGNGYLEIERSRRTREPVGLWPMLPDRTRLEVRRGVDGVREVVYPTSINGMPEVVPARDVCHIKGYSFDGLIGMSPVSIARQAIGLGLAMEEFGAKFFANDAKSGGFLMHPGKLGQKAVENLSSSFGEEGQGGRQGWHKPKILEEGMKWQSTTIPPEDAQFLGSREFQIAEICRIYRVPLILVQSHEKTTSWGSGIEQLMIGFVTYTLDPWVRRWEQEISRKLLSEAERVAGFYVKFNVNALLRGDMAARQAFYSGGIGSGWLMPSEVREKEDLAPIPGLDDRRMNGGAANAA